MRRVGEEANNHMPVTPVLTITGKWTNRFKLNADNNITATISQM
jgi:hypothetical protein